MKAMKWLIAIGLVLSIETIVTRSAEAGPLLDWLTGKNRNQPPAQVAYMPASGCETCTMTCQRTVVNYVPQTQYRTQWTQVPVTQYRPVTSSDPCSGCTVTCMRPCTTYEWRAQRVPYTTYRPVYNTVTVQRPVTSMMPVATLPPTSGCSTCGVATAGSAYPAANGGVLTPGGSYLSSPQPTPSYGATPPTSYGATPYPAPSSGSPSAADQPPTLDPRSLPPTTTQRIMVPPREDSSILNRSTPTSPAPSSVPPSVNTPINPAPSSAQNSSQPRSEIQPVQDPAPNLRLTPPPAQAPALLNQDQTARSPVHRDWSYSPVRLAVYQSSGDSGTKAQTAQYSSPRPEPTAQPATSSLPWRSLSRD